MLKLAVVGAGTLLGRELVEILETRECSVLPLSHGPMSKEEEEGDMVVFAPQPSLLEGLDLVILVETPDSPELFQGFKGRILDLRAEADPQLPPMPLVGGWPKEVTILRGRPALEQVLATLPALVEGLGDVAGTHLRSVAYLGDRGLDGLMEQTAAIFKGEDPDTAKLGYRAAFELVPQAPRGRLVEVRVPTFHGDLLLLHLKASQGQILRAREAPKGTAWVEQPPTSREVGMSPNLLAHLALADEGQSAVLTLGFDPILWGVLSPTLRLLEL